MSDYWYAWEPSSYAKKTAHLTMIQHGAYRLLLDYYYQVGGPIPAIATANAQANLDSLLRVCRAFAQAEREAIEFVLAEFFELRDGRFHHHRCDEEIAKRTNLRKIRAEAGAKGGAIARANAQANGKQLPTQSQLQSQLQIQEERGSGSEAYLGDAKPSPIGQEALEGGNGLGNDDAALVANSWNLMAEDHGLPQVKRITPGRRQKIKDRAKDAGGLIKLVEVIEQIPSQPFLLGKNQRGWKADLDWILEPRNFVKLEERKFANGHG